MQERVQVVRNAAAAAVRQQREIVDGDRAYRSGTTALAGAVVLLDECVRRFRKYAGCTAVRALEAAARFLRSKVSSQRGMVTQRGAAILRK